MRESKEYERMRTGRIIVIAAGLLLAGCATTHMPAGPQLPANAKMVGGGLSIEWTAPAKGTAILIETSSGKIVRTQSVDAGDSFSFDPTANENIRVLNSMFGGPGPQDNQELPSLPKDTHFALYFVPAEPGSQP